MAEIRNPNQQGGGGGGQDSRTILIFSAVFLVLFVGLQYFKTKNQPATPAGHSQTAATTTTTSSSEPSNTASTPSSPTAVAPASANTVAASAENTTIVENELYRITFTNQGAQVKSWILKKYKDDDGKPLDLVNHATAPKFGYPLSLYAYDQGLRSRLASALYVPSATGTVEAPGSISFDYSSGGLSVHKTFHFDSTYVVHAEVSVTQNGAPVTALLAWPSGFGDQSTLPQYAGGTVDSSQNGKDDQIAYKKVVGGETLHGPFDWAGVSDLYFAAIFLPDDPSSATLVSLHNYDPGAAQSQEARSESDRPGLGSRGCHGRRRWIHPPPHLRRTEVARRTRIGARRERREPRKGRQFRLVGSCCQAALPHPPLPLRTHRAQLGMVRSSCSPSSSM